MLRDDYVGLQGINSWVNFSCRDTSYEAKHLVIAQLVDWIEIRKNDGYDMIGWEWLL